MKIYLFVSQKLMYRYNICIFIVVYFDINNFPIYEVNLLIQPAYVIKGHHMM